MIVYRPGVPEDGSGLLSVHTRAIQLVGVNEYGPEVVHSWSHGLTAEGYIRSMATGEIFEVASADGAIVGFCGFKLGVIYGLFVDPDYMRRGVASRLLSAALSWMHAQKCPRVEIEATLTAVPFYQRHGFRSLATKNKATRGGIDMRVVDMERQIGPNARLN